MKIKISSIPPRGFNFRDELDPNALNNRLNEGENNDIIVKEAAVLTATFSKTPQGAELKGTLTGSVSQPCGRCGEMLEHSIETEIDYTLHPRIEGKEVEEDIGITYYEDDHFDTTEIAQEAFIMAQSPFWKPDPKAGEVCPGCERLSASDLQKKTKLTKLTLGDLLKKAGVN